MDRRYVGREIHDTLDHAFLFIFLSLRNAALHCCDQRIPVIHVLELDGVERSDRHVVVLFGIEWLCLKDYGFFVLGIERVPVLILVCGETCRHVERINRLALCIADRSECGQLLGKRTTLTHPFGMLGECVRARVEFLFVPHGTLAFEFLRCVRLLVLGTPQIEGTFDPLVAFVSLFNEFAVNAGLL